MVCCVLRYLLFTLIIPSIFHRLLFGDHTLRVPNVFIHISTWPSPYWHSEETHFNLPPKLSTCCRVIFTSMAVRLSLDPWLKASRWWVCNAFASVTRTGCSDGQIGLKMKSWGHQFVPESDNEFYIVSCNSCLYVNCKE